MAAQAPPARHWCFTLNNPDLYPDELLEQIEKAQYVVFQLEEGENGTPHYQGYCIFAQKQRLTALRGLFGGRAHWEQARGTPEQNRAYCTKEGRIGEITEWGEIPGNAGQGARTDLDELHSALKAGLTQADYANGYFSLFVRYPNLVQNYRISQFGAPYWLLPPNDGPSFEIGLYMMSGVNPPAPTSCILKIEATVYAKFYGRRTLVQ